MNRRPLSPRRAPRASRRRSARRSSRTHRVAIVIPDITRPLPSDRLLPWVLAELSHVPAERITIVIGTGSHRATTDAEIRSLVGESIAATYAVVNHDAFDPAKLARAGIGKDGHEVFLNRAYVEADRRIVLGFVEPHFMAGFSGGYKGIFPGVADIASIMRYHDARMIGDPRSTWGLLDGNPTQERIRHDGALDPGGLLRQRDAESAPRDHRRVLRRRQRRSSRRAAPFPGRRRWSPAIAPLPIVVTTNSGYPLDQNLYQAVKGMSAAAQVVADGGYIVTAARCNDGFPRHGNFKQLLFEHASPQSLLDTIMTPGFSLFDQWQAQLLARILIKARVGLHSELPADDVRRAHLEPVEDVERALAAELTRIGRDAPIAVLPEGPMTIPYVASASRSLPAKAGSHKSGVDSPHTASGAAHATHRFAEKFPRRPHCCGRLTDRWKRRSRLRRLAPPRGSRVRASDSTNTTPQQSSPTTRIRTGPPRQ